MGFMRCAMLDCLVPRLGKTSDTLNDLSSRSFDDLQFV